MIHIVPFDDTAMVKNINDYKFHTLEFRAKVIACANHAQDQITTNTRDQDIQPMIRAAYHEMTLACDARSKLDGEFMNEDIRELVDELHVIFGSMLSRLDTINFLFRKL